jgi:hypothetical protein
MSRSWNHPDEIEVTTHDVVLPRLPRALSGLTAAQISDLHRGCGGTDDLIRAAVERVNRLEPDVVFVTGDFVDEEAKDIPAAVEMVAGLRARQGVYGVLGNHDQRGDPLRLKAALAEAGLHMLQNRARMHAPGLWFAGIDDLLEGAPDLPAALRYVPHDAAVVLLSHNPNGFDRLTGSRSLLMLSGHTHGAQIVVPFPPPWLVCRLHLHTRYVHGWTERGAQRLYVNRGIGVTGAGPFARRVNCRPEITLFRFLSDASEEPPAP